MPIARKPASVASQSPVDPSTGSTITVGSTTHGRQRRRAGLLRLPVRRGVLVLLTRGAPGRASLAPAYGLCSLSPSAASDLGPQPGDGRRIPALGVGLHRGRAVVGQLHDVGAELELRGHRLVPSDDLPRVDGRPPGTGSSNRSPSGASTRPVAMRRSKAVDGFGKGISAATGCPRSVTSNRSPARTRSR